jgi:hypothetical protein
MHLDMAQESDVALTLQSAYNGLPDGLFAETGY